MVGPTRDLALGTSFSTSQVVPGTTTDYTLDLAKYIASESLKKLALHTPQYQQVWYQVPGRPTRQQHHQSKCNATNTAIHSSLQQSAARHRLTGKKITMMNTGKLLPLWLKVFFFFFFSQPMLIIHRARFLVVCWEVFRPFEDWR